MHSGNLQPISVSLNTREKYLQATTSASTSLHMFVHLWLSVWFVDDRYPGYCILVYQSTPTSPGYRSCLAAKQEVLSPLS